MIIKAGRLSERVTLQNPPTADDGAGGQTGAWATVGTYWASVEAVRGAEGVQAAILTTVTQYKVIMRRLPVTTDQRLTWAGQALNIRAVLPDSDRAAVTLLCEGVAL